MNSLSSVQAIPPSKAVVDRIANCEGVDPTELMPLFEVIDPEALDALVGTAERGDSGLQVEFSYHGYDVTVTGEGVVHVNEVANSPWATA